MPTFQSFFIFWTLVGYLLGSIPFGLLLTRSVGGPDLRSFGSGNIGATNVLRTGRKGLAALTLLLDAAKAAVPIIVAARYERDYALCAAGGAFLGHLFPIWLGFKGGKGVATMIGCLVGLWWPAAVFFCSVWLLTAVVTRYSSASALAASLASPLFLAVFGRGAEAAVCAAMSMMLWLKHRPNITRLLAGSESRIGRTS